MTAQTSVASKRRREKESRIVVKNLPYFKRLLASNKISTKEKLRVLEDVNMDIAAYLLSIGEEV